MIDQRVKLVLGCWVALLIAAEAMARKSGDLPTRQMEYMDRGVVSLNQGDGQVYIGWRLLATDPEGVGFDIYRKTPDGMLVRLNTSLIQDTTDFVDKQEGALVPGTQYVVQPVLGKNRGPLETVTVPEKSSPYLSVKLDPIRKHHANDCSVGDLDGDGRYEIIVKWEADNARDNSQAGKTDNVYLDAYTLDGRKLWRIDLGPNIRAGAHYTQFMVYDLDGDGRAEVVCKTADGTVDGQGQVIGDDEKEWRNDAGYVLAGPEFLTCFDGRSGAALSTVDYIPERYSGSRSPSSDDLQRTWGDGYGNRCDRFLACVAYLDGVHPSVVMCRGYYTRTVLVAWDFNRGKLKKRWIFDSDREGREWTGQGNHNLSVGDVDGDGKDEIMYGAMCVDDDGDGIYSTELGHGDAAHLADLDPSRPGLEFWCCQEHPPFGASYRDAGTGEIIMRWEGPRDTGRACAADIDPTHPGCEMWAATGCPLFDSKGTVIAEKYPLPMNFVINWDDDDLQELLDGTRISKYNWNSGSMRILLDAAAYDCTANNGTKATPCLSADLFGDYREEVIWRTEDSSELRIFTTTIPAKRRLITLMQDPQYRLSIVWQNVAYNQPPHTSFYMGDGMVSPPRPNITVIRPRP